MEINKFLLTQFSLRLCASASLNCILALIGVRDASHPFGVSREAVNTCALAYLPHDLSIL